MYCKNCGAVLNENDFFCKQCGQPIQTTNTIQSDFNQNSTPNYDNYSNNSFNQYQNTPKGNSNIGIIILIIVLAIVFWFIGYGLCKIAFNVKSESNNNSAVVQDTNYSKTTSDNNNNNSSNEANYIVTDNGIKVTFKLPSTLRIDNDYSSSCYKCIEKIDDDDNDFTAWIGEEYNSLNEYIEEVQDKAISKKSNNDYSDVQISDIQTMTVNNYMFTYILLDYKMGSTQFKEAYIAYELEEDSLYSVELDRYDLISSDELKDLLTITISK